MDVPERKERLPSFYTLELSESQDCVKYVFMCNCTRFYVNIREQDLHSTGNSFDEFNNFRENIDDFDTMSQFEEWILDALDDHLLKLAPTPEPNTRNSITLLDYFAPPIYAFRLPSYDGSLCAIQENYDPQIHCDSSPKTWLIESMPSPGHSELERPFLLVSNLLPVPLMFASQLERVDEVLRPEELSDVPRKVRQLRSGDEFFFRPGFKDYGHLRELEILSQINSSGKFKAPFRTSRLVGLVIWDGDSSILMGFLLEYIDGETLAERANSVSLEAKRKWIGQIEATLRRLHDSGIVWGDVKPDSVMINTDDDAVTIDFGGSFALKYIEYHLKRAQKGDMMALSRMREEMGIPT
ncbi:Fc.00g114490.m01.CDS01 [Cosmosporella sp. VM-42]